jgi:hypothetical protein
MWVDCPECSGLEAECNRLKEVHGRIVERFFNVGYQLTDAEYTKLKRATEIAQINLDVARLKLKHHKRAVHSHGR